MIFNCTLSSSGELWNDHLLFNLFLRTKEEEKENIIEIHFVVSLIVKWNFSFEFCRDEDTIVVEQDLHQSLISVEVNREFVLEANE